MLHGIAVSDGIVIAKAYKYELPDIVIKTRNVEVDEKEKVIKAIEKTKADFSILKNLASKNFKADDLVIFDSLISMLSDPLYLSEIDKAISNGYPAELAIKMAKDNITVEFENINDQYIKERTNDISNVSYRVLCNLLDLDIPDILSINEPSIIVAKDLFVSDIALIDRNLVLGLACEESSVTSHLSIATKSMSLPTCVGVNGLMENCKNGDVVILDSIEGNVIINPSKEEIEEYKNKGKQYEEYKKKLQELIGKETRTADGRKVKLVCNITSIDDISNTKVYGGEGIGLFRTEFMYINRTTNFPNEEEQFSIYKSLLEKNDNRVVIRTLDIGGDKQLPYYEFPKEANPFLGYRAIRFCLDKKDVFKAQLRALLRASVYGKLGIMFPMISTMNELLQAKEILLETKNELISEDIQISDDIEIGMMIETPASAILAEHFAKEVDFFSIGSNDLIQYAMAADRQSEEVSYLYQPLNPSILRFVKIIIDGAHKHGKKCAMCGEMASDKYAIPILLGMGLDEFSMAPSSVLKARDLFRNISYEKVSELAKEAITKSRQEEVLELVKKYIK